MPAPFLSVVVPAYNEEGRIARTIAEIAAEIERLALDAELIVVDDGSTDRTASIVAGASRGDTTVTLVRAAHGGKGAAVRRGMLAARGAWRFLADADLSMPITELSRFLDDAARGGDVFIGSREVTGARRVGEPRTRHAVGRLFNWMVKLVVLRGIEDTQCGFKLFSARAAETLFPLQQIDGFGFDVEILFLARRAGFAVREIPVTWVWGRGSKVNLASGARGFLDLAVVRVNQARGLYPPRRTVVTPPAPAGRERQT